MARKIPVRDFEAYLLSLRLLKQRRLIVEGIDDWAVMDTLMKELKRTGQLQEVIPVDSAENVASPIGLTLGNREKVEMLCARLKNAPEAAHVVGFVDREYRGFQFDHGIQDTLGSHRVQERVLWTRGHSIENYFFDFQLFSEAVLHYSKATERYAALTHLHSSFSSVIRTACALALAARDHGKLAMVRRTVRWKDVLLVARACIDKDEWLKHIHKSHPKIDGAAIFATFEARLGELELCDDDTVRWLCDGHLGLGFVLAAFQRAVYEVSGKDSAAADNALAIKRDDFVPCGAIIWSKRACLGETCWPEELPSLLSA